MSDFGLRHDDCGLFRRAWERGGNCRREDDSPLQSTPAYADAAGGCGRVLVLTNSGQAPFRSLGEQKPVLAPNLFLPPSNSFTGMFYCRSQRRDTVHLFLLCYVIQD